jgi:hypothetical protein
VLQTAKEIAATKGISTGKALSGLVRQAFERRPHVKVRNGVPLLPRRPPGSPIPTMKLVNELRDDY